MSEQLRFMTHCKAGVTPLPSTSNEWRPTGRSCSCGDEAPCGQAADESVMGMKGAVLAETGLKLVASADKNANLVSCFVGWAKPLNSIAALYVAVP